MCLQFLTAEASPKGDPYALLLLLGIVAVFSVWILIRNKKKKSSVTVQPIPEKAPKAELPKAPGAAGQLKLNNVSPKTAAMVMAIVADKMGKPLNELRFLSIKEVE